MDVKQIIYVSAKILKLKGEANFVVPFERYIKRYKPNGYYTKDLKK